jgi:hypothetical protein
MANQSNSFGIFSGSGGGGASGVTSVTAGTGLTASPNPITATGTISLDDVNGLVSTFDGANGSLVTLGSAGSITMYDPTTYPATTFTMTQNGRAFFGLNTAGSNERLGLGGVGTHDLITLTATVSTNCTSGLFIAAGAGSGILAQTFTSSPASIACNGTQQTQTITTPDFRVGNTGASPSDPSTDFFNTTYIYSGSGGQARYTDITITITQFSD